MEFMSRRLAVTSRRGVVNDEGDVGTEALTSGTGVVSKTSLRFIVVDVDDVVVVDDMDALCETTSSFDSSSFDSSILSFVCCCRVWELFRLFFFASLLATCSSSRTL